MSRRTCAVVLAVIVIAVSAGGTAYWWRTRPATAAPIDDARRPETPMTSGAPAPVAEPARGDVTIDTRRQQLIGVRLVPVARTTITDAITAPGVVRYDETRQTDVNVKLDGWIRELDVDFTGQPVRRGQRLFTLYSPELLATQNEFILALRHRDQATSSPLTDAGDYADRLVEAARQRLALWDLSVEDLARIEMSREPVQAIGVVAPVSGFVADKQAVRGMRVTAGQTLYRIVDLTVVWVDADVSEQDMSRLRIGQRATVTLDALPGRRLSGRASYIYPEVNQQMRTARVRLQFDNPGGRLKPGMFANVELRGSERQALTVPSNAVLDAGTQQTVFVAEGEGVFTPRRVKVRRRVGDIAEVVEGLKEGEQVAAAAAFFLDSESQLRAGLLNYEAAPATPRTLEARPALDIAFRPITDPPRTGDNTFEVSVKDAAGQPVADADVSVQLVMPAMPTMNMPAMRNEIRLPPVGSGVYRGPGQVMTGGRWEATVTVSRDGQRPETRQFVVVAR